MKTLFPFSLKEYLKVFLCYIVFFAVIYGSSFAVSSYTASAPQSPDKAAAGMFVVSLVAVLLGSILLNFFLFIFTLSFAYSIIAKRKFHKLWPKFILSTLLLALIFLVPFMFSARLIIDKNPAAVPVLAIVFFISLHFSNLSYLFTSLTGKAVEGLRKGFWFGTYKMKKLVIPYVFVLIAFAVFSLVTRILKNLDFLNLVIAGVILSWAALYAGRSVVEKDH